MAETISLREGIAAQMKEAMKAGDKVRVGALRLIMSALKDREIEARGAGKIVSRGDELALLTKMTKTRQESLYIYKENGREDLAAQESAEIAIINEFLPKQMDEAAVVEAVRSAIAETGASGMRDMGKVVSVLKEKYPGQMDFGRASAIVKGLLAPCPRPPRSSAASASIVGRASARTRATPRPPISSARRSPAWGRGSCLAGAGAA